MTDRPKTSQATANVSQQQGKKKLDPQERLRTLKQYVYSNIELPHGEYKALDWGVKDFIIRQNGLETISQKRNEKESEYDANAQPEYKNFFKSHEVYQDLREKMRLSHHFMEKQVM